MKEYKCTRHWLENIFSKNDKYIILVVIHMYRKPLYSKVHLKCGKIVPDNNLIVVNIWMTWLILFFISQLLNFDTRKILL